ncbi:MAG: L-aspartate oxidase [Hyphomicrobiales bacterium]|nr:L-aspartate oxidase [Hyphomicrobiales bacterium]
MSEVIIIGGGLAGLFAALKLAPMPVTVLTPKPLGEGASSAWAQGGVAAAIGEGDSADKHAADTIAAGAGLCNEAVVRMIVGEAGDRIHDLLDYGVPFDRDLEGKLKLSREAAHGERRIVRVQGDQAGRAIMSALIAAVRATPSITVLENVSALELGIHDGRVTGVWCAKENGAPFYMPARAVVLATGGIGQLYKVTTNPLEARGEGLAMAARAGAVIADAEFVQFHPTALDIGRSPAPLATEALRGEGAFLVNRKGERFMEGQHEALELGPRDIVARAVESEVQTGRGAFLDCRGKLGARIWRDFPAVFAACRSAGLNPEHDLIPIAPAAHYHMGGVATDMHGRTTVDGLWAIGEVACTGLHGANRLASNSLLEAVVMAARAASDIANMQISNSVIVGLDPTIQRVRRVLSALDGRVKPGHDMMSGSAQLQTLMTAQAGLERTGKGLLLALSELEAIAVEPMLHAAGDVARFVLIGALLRRESRGGHYRSDFKLSAPAARIFITLSEAKALSENLLSLPRKQEHRAAAL